MIFSSPNSMMSTIMDREGFCLCYGCHKHSRLDPNNCGKDNFVTKMHMLRWMCQVIRKNSIRTKHLRGHLQVVQR